MTHPAVESPFVIRAPQGRALRDARAILDEARTEAARIRADAEAERAGVLAQARLEGLAQAAREAAPLAAEAAAAIARFWAEREAELRDLALAIAHRVLSQLPAEDVAVRLATEAVAEHGRDTRLALRVSADLLAPFRAALDAQAFGQHATVAADPDMPPGGCALLHPRGRTELGLLAQFRAMMGASPPHEAKSS